ncbi:MAG: LysR family transcriptional regulator [Acidiferrobacterales bacterium]|nr:LysR family transcriptional regulator [Acidiferrobacterales bacterium]
MLDWTDLRYFAAVSRVGSLGRAARELGVNHSTVFRRINALERELGVKLFERTPAGYVLTAAGEEMRSTAAQVEDQIIALDRRLSGRDYQLSGNIRVTTTDTIGLWFVQRHLYEFHQVYPGIQVELVISNELFSLSKREADIAIRPTQNPPEELVGRHICDIAWAVYGSRGYLKDKPKLRRLSDLARHTLVSGDDSLAQLAASRWLHKQAPGAEIGYRSNSLMTQLSAVKAGFGLAVLPCFLGDSESELARVFAPDASLTSGLWLLTHRDLRDTARIRAFMDFMTRSIRSEKSLLEGKRLAINARSKAKRNRG